MVFHFSPFLSNEHCSLKQISILTNCFHTYAIHVHIHCKLNQGDRYFGLKIESKSFPIEAAKGEKNSQNSFRKVSWKSQIEYIFYESISIKGTFLIPNTLPPFSGYTIFTFCSFVHQQPQFQSKLY